MFTVFHIRVGSCASSILQLKQTRASASLMVYSGFIHTMYSTKARSPERSESDVTIQNGNRVFSAQSFLDICAVACLETKWYFNVFLVLNSNIPEVRCRCSGYVEGSVIQLFYLSSRWALERNLRGLIPTWKVPTENLVDVVGKTVVLHLSKGRRIFAWYRIPEMPAYLQPPFQHFPKRASYTNLFLRSTLFLSRLWRETDL